MSYYDQPSDTMVPNKLRDQDMSALSGAERKVLRSIVRGGGTGGVGADES